MPGNLPLLSLFISNFENPSTLLTAEQIIKYLGKTHCDWNHVFKSYEDECVGHPKRSEIIRSSSDIFCLKMVVKCSTYKSIQGSLYVIKTENLIMLLALISCLVFKELLLDAYFNIFQVIVK